MGEWSSNRRTTKKEAAWSVRFSNCGDSSLGHSGYSVPPWEIKFCSQISWSKFCEDKKLTHLFENVLNWDDSAGKESFDNAKARYWAEINGAHCDIPTPDPYMHIDVVNHDAFLDPRLVEDLYKPPPPPPCTDALDYNSIEIIPTGWDVVDPAIAGAPIPIFISVVDQQPVTSILKDDVIGTPVTIIPTGWGDEEDARSSHVCNVSGTHSNDALCSESRGMDHRNANFGPNHAWKPSGTHSNDALCFENINQDHKNNNFNEIHCISLHRNEYYNKANDRRRGNARDTGRRFSLNHSSVRDRSEYCRMNTNFRGFWKEGELMHR